jgi:hypothetical protein
MSAAALAEAILGHPASRWRLALPSPEPVEPGELGELLEGLRLISDGMSALGHELDSWVVARAATLLEQQAAPPVPVVVSKPQPHGGRMIEPMP